MPASPSDGAGGLQDAARPFDERAGIALVVGPLEIEVVEQQRQQHTHAEAVQRVDQRQRRRLAADADEGRDRAISERLRVRRQRVAEQGPLVRTAARALLAHRPPKLCLHGS